MLPRPDWRHTKVVLEHRGMELLHGRTYGKHDENSLDNSGGGGEFPAFFKRDTKKKQQEKARKEYNYLLSVEQRLKNLEFRHSENKKEFERLMENYPQSRKSQEGTNSNK